MIQAKLMHVIASASAAWLPFCFAMIIVPLEIYSGNRIEFGFAAGILWPLVVAAVAVLIVLILICLYRPAWSVYLAAAGCLLGVWLLLADTLTPLRWNVDGQSLPASPSKDTLLQGALMVGALAAWLFVPRRLVASFGAPLAAVLAVWALSHFAMEVALRAPVGVEAGQKRSEPSGKPLPNIYHVVFDGYAGQQFMPTLSAVNGTSEFRGFTYFSQHRANYVLTDMSVPSAFNGRYFAGGDVAVYQSEARTSGFRQALQSAGYEITVYAPDDKRFWAYRDAEKTVSSAELLSGSSYWTNFIDIVHFTLVRISPNPLRMVVHRAMDKLFLYGRYKSISLPLIDRFISDEAKRPSHNQYVYLHVLLPHAPFVRGAACEPLPRRGTYSQQTACATMQMARINRMLGRLGKLDNSMVIFMSDHGYDQESSLLPGQGGKASDDALAALHGVHEYFSGEEFIRRTFALLAIKPPRPSREDLVVSKAPTQMVDIPVTVGDAVGVAMPAGDGVSVFSLRSDTNRTVHFFGGFVRREHGRHVTLGKEIDSASIAHIAYSKNAGWTVLPELIATHSGVARVQ